MNRDEGHVNSPAEAGPGKSMSAKHGVRQSLFVTLSAIFVLCGLALALLFFNAFTDFRKIGNAGGTPDPQLYNKSISLKASLKIIRMEWIITAESEEDVPIAWRGRTNPAALAETAGMRLIVGMITGISMVVIGVWLFLHGNHYSAKADTGD